MRWTLLATIFLLSGPIGGRRQIARADEPADGPGRIFKDVFIENLAGEWKLTRKIRGKEVENTATAEWVLNHQFLKLQMKDVADPPTYEALVLIGYDHADHK